MSKYPVIQFTAGTVEHELLLDSLLPTQEVQKDSRDIILLDVLHALKKRVYPGSDDRLKGAAPRRQHDVYTKQARSFAAALLIAAAVPNRATVTVTVTSEAPDWLDGTGFRPTVDVF